ncbi:MAG: hypothetical protein Q3M24_03870 [Candidatus Electrothrix aestuarii]|uniref:Uncharacterized protein n=1 Tax=Candidatus Electrothrix aestuarii TaxID=3062594 RepID=A0AAU8LYC3_9BACT
MIDCQLKQHFKGSPSKMNKDFIPDFSGKCISMMLIDEEHSHDLHDPYFEYQGGRLFIIGIIPEMATVSGWTGNQIGGVAWDRVRDYVLFGSLEAYIEAVHKSESCSQDEDE